MSLQACADIVAKGDPDRFAAVMAAPVMAREILLPLYAFNVEVTRAPWVASEPMIGEMRLQWWRDALEEIAKGQQVRKHEVSTPLGGVLDAPACDALDKLIQARRWDLYKDAFEDAAHFDSYLSATGGHLMWTGARLLGAAAEAEPSVTAIGHASALARFMRAVPQLEEKGRIPLVDGRPEAIAALATRALEKLPTRSALHRMLPKAARAAVLEGWQTAHLLGQIQKEPQRVADDQLGQSEFRRRASLMMAAWRL